MKYLVTGGAGFIGCNAVQRWLAAGHTVVVLDDLSRRGADANLAWLQAQRGELLFERIDIRDAALLDAAGPPPRGPDAFRTMRSGDV